MQHLSGLAELSAAYDGYIVDLWGVIHDGITPFADALACLEHLRGKPVLLLSNAPRRAEAARVLLRALGVEDALYRDLLTSGEATWLALRERKDPWFAGLGKRLHHLGPERDRSTFEGLGLSLSDGPADADFVLNTGPDDHRDGQTLEAFAPELDACLRAGLKMICANPDLEIVRGGARILCAGALAAYYTANGGDVRSIGKPDPAIYAQALNRLGVQPSRVLAIGDSLRTDIVGAATAGIDSVWVTGGIHAEELGDDPQAARNAADRAGLRPTAFMSQLAW